MAVYPVIMCGGSGLRLWPASRRWRPKQFLPLTGTLSSFQETALRVAPLGSASLVVAGVAHEAFVTRQLAEVGQAATLLLEPEPRESAAAIAAACTWIAARDPDGVAVIVSADHHIPDAEAFREAVRRTLPAAEGGAIVTLGVQPSAPSTAYGYIRPASGDAPARVEAFVEKPDAARAGRYVAEGYLWNSGNFVARAQTMLDELRHLAPGVAEAASEAVATGSDLDGALVLGEAFGSAPKISIDYAVMEKTSRAAVLPVDFDWSDLGAWDAVLAGSARDARGVSAPRDARILEARNVIVRAPPDRTVAVAGVSDVAVVVDGNDVLVCALNAAQHVKTLAALPVPQAFADLGEAAGRYAAWLRTAALPLWSTLGADSTGFFRDALGPDGFPAETRRRMRTQARQTFVFATVATDSRFLGPWLEVARRGVQALEAGRRADGLYVNAFDLSGAVADPEAYLYEQAFVLLALSALDRADPGGGWRARAQALAERLDGFRHAAGGYREAGEHGYQANAQMHLMESALALAEPHFDAVADEIAELALSRFIDPDSGALREFFDEDWRPLQAEQNLIEPGHQFEWAWLLTRWGERRGDPRGRAAAERLYEVGRKGVDPTRSVAVNALKPDLTVRDGAARLWPQTEWLKAALILGRGEDALTAASGLWRYLETPTRGLWRDRLRADGGFVDGPAPGTSLYHLAVAIRELQAAAG